MLYLKKSTYILYILLLLAAIIVCFLKIQPEISI